MLLVWLVLLFFVGSIKITCRLACISPAGPGKNNPYSMSEWYSKKKHTFIGAGPQWWRAPAFKEKFMKTSRRKFAQLVGASLVAPVIAPTAGLSYIERAELEVEQTGEVSAELTLALLDAQGARSIFT